VPLVRCVAHSPVVVRGVGLSRHLDGSSKPLDV
jgi:hypothetical protein